MNPRLRRLESDYNQIRTAFAGHRLIDVEPIQGNPPEKYRVVYRVKGVSKLGSSGPVISQNHKAIIYLHADYPRSKPKLEMETPIWHPNFGPYICIDDHWGAGETLVDIIVQIGDMIQYRSYNPKSPLNAVAAKWSMENRHLFPIGNVDLYQSEPEIELDAGIGEDLFIELGSPRIDDDDDLDIQLG